MDELVWIALETVGEDPTTCEVLEVAAVVTDSRLAPLRRFQSTIMSAQDRPTTIQLRIGRDVRERYASNGLWAEMELASVVPLSADHNLARMVGLHSQSSPLATVSSTWDRSVLAAQFPEVSALLSVEAWDVDSFAGLARTFIPRATLVPQLASQGRVAFRLESNMQNLANVVNAIRGVKGTTAP